MSKTTKEILKEMLTEDTGKHFLDSGGAYGRNYERNQGRDFDSESPTSLNFSVRNGSLEIEMTHTLYHYLAERVDYDSEVDELFYGKFLEENDSDDKSWFELADEFPAWLEKQTDEDGELIYGECETWNADNTYNHDNLLSQDVCYKYFKTENCGEYIILMVHGGCDIRGGYTKPHIFTIDTNDSNFFDYARATIYCTGKDHHPTAAKIKEKQEIAEKNQVKLPGIPQPLGIDFGHDKCWITDDGCNWGEDGSWGGNYKNLEDMECKDLDEDDEWEPGKICVKDGVGYCPVCGAKLAGSMY